MKLSDIKGDRTIDVIAEIIEPVINIAEDKEASALFERKECPEGISAKDFVLARVKTALPKLMKSHKDDLITILATIEGKPIEQYRSEMSLASVIGGLIELFTDDEFLGFF
jgi:hypothetical protein